PGGLQAVAGFGFLGEQALGVAAAAADRLGVLALEEAAQAVVRDPVEPAAERPLAGVGAPAAGGPGPGTEHPLGPAGGVGVLQAGLAGEGVHQPAVQLDELLPRRAVLPVAQPGEQAGTGTQGIVHHADLAGALAPLLYTRRGGMTEEGPVSSGAVRG